jgi:hypothetical protein
MKELVENKFVINSVQFLVIIKINKSIKRNIESNRYVI